MFVWRQDEEESTGEGKKQIKMRGLIFTIISFPHITFASLGFQRKIQNNIENFCFLSNFEKTRNSTEI